MPVRIQQPDPGSRAAAGRWAPSGPVAGVPGVQVHRRDLDGRLRGAVGVEEGTGREAAPPDREPLGEEALAARAHHAQGRRQGKVLRLQARRDLVPVRRGQDQRGDPPLPAALQEGRDRGEHGVVAQHQLRPAGQAGEDLVQAQVEGHRGGLEHPVPGPDLVEPGHARRVERPASRAAPARPWAGRSSRTCRRGRPRSPEGARRTKRYSSARSSRTGPGPLEVRERSLAAPASTTAARESSTIHASRSSGCVGSRGT